MAENSRDLIIVADFEGRRSFVSRVASGWGDWTREEILHQGSLDLVHPDDCPGVRQTVRELKSGKDGALIECRVRRKDGSYAWVESSLRTIRDPITKLPTGILNNVRDISERKYVEQQLEDAFHAVEALAVTDALTGLANRRRFDQYLASEWSRALREHLPLAMVLIDADFFKLYNDTYGHPQGDACLRHIADCVKNAVSRATDLGARIGGEEFAILLPNTSLQGAWQLANRICEDMRARALPHAASPHAIMTLSAGCSSIFPEPGQPAAQLIHLADQAMYNAKRGGRNCVYPLPPHDPGPEGADATIFVGWGS